MQHEASSKHGSSCWLFLGLFFDNEDGDDIPLNHGLILTELQGVISEVTGVLKS